VLALYRRLPEIDSLAWRFHRAWANSLRKQTGRPRVVPAGAQIHNHHGVRDWQHWNSANGTESIT